MFGAPREEALIGALTSPNLGVALNSVGGDTNGDGSQTSPNTGDWTGLSLTGDGTANLAYTHAAYATTALASSTDNAVTVQNDVFAANGTALYIAATVGTNAAIHGNWFDGNGNALDGSSIWDPGDASPFVPCQYIPTMSATGNTYGAKQLSTPFISPSDDVLLTAALVASGGQEYPDGWSSGLNSVRAMRSQPTPSPGRICRAPTALSRGRWWSPRRPLRSGS